MKIGVNCFPLRPDIGGIKQYFLQIFNELLEILGYSIKSFSHISDYKVKVPINGFFIGIEGVYPNDFLSSEDNLVELTEKEIKQIKKGELAYGQEIGCVRKKNNNTWHYSLSHTCFKANYTNIEIMVYAVIKYKIYETIADINIEKNQLKNEHED